MNPLNWLAFPSIRAKTRVIIFSFVKLRFAALGILLAIALFAFTPAAQSQKLETLYVFTNISNGADPIGKLVEGKDGYFYGTTWGGGLSNLGTVFRITSTGTLTTLVSFVGTNGARPQAELVQGSDNDFYGTTYFGGSSTNINIDEVGDGTIFKMTSAGGLTTLASFDGTNGTHLGSGLVQATNGQFYGTAALGGISNSGVFFRIATNGFMETLTSFVGGQDGKHPSSTLLLGSDNSFYGTTGAGSINNGGTVFKITPTGDLSTLASIQTSNAGAHSLVMASDGNFYGLSHGTVFKMTTNGVLSTVVEFTGSGDPYSGGFPYGIDPNGLEIGSDGKLFGVASGGGAFGFGTVFEVKENQSPPLTILASFNPYIEGQGGYPSRIMQGKDGNLYGVTRDVGSNFGTVYRVIMAPTLGILQNGDELLISWLTNFPGFTLQSAADLNSPTNWIDSTNAPVVVGAQFTVTNNISASAQFYRLKKP